jgi:sugar lactone lactonase YvrE
MRFDEVIEGILPALYEMESYQYRTIYSYQAGEEYLEDELALEVIGKYSRLVDPAIYDEEPISLPITLISQYFEESHMVITDLHSNLKTETVINNEGIWLRIPDQPDWIHLKNASRANLFIFPELFDPHYLAFMTAGGGSLAPGIRTGIPDNVTSEVINGNTTKHRCWVVHPSEDWDIGGYLIYQDNLYSYLGDFEVHLWTIEDDTQLFRLAIEGLHVGERYFDYGVLDHDDNREFTLWSELSNVNENVHITPPSKETSFIEIPFGQYSQTKINVDYQGFPVPEDARIPNVELSNEEIEQFEWLKPREYIYEQSELISGFLNSYLGSGWDGVSEDRLVLYESDLSFTDTILYYLDQQGQRGWSLENYVLQITEGENQAVLIFSRDGAPLAIDITGKTNSPSIIAAVLPPSEEMIQILQAGWRKYTQANSGLASNEVEDIAFDDTGQAWIVSPENLWGGFTTVSPEGSKEIPVVEGGLSLYDGETWTTFTSEDTAVPIEDLKLVAIDKRGHTWVASRSNLHVFNGISWKTFTSDNYGIEGSISGMAFDSVGRLWISVDNFGRNGGVSMYDLVSWQTYPFLHSIESLVINYDNRPIVGSDGGGVYILEDGNWVDISVPDTDSVGFTFISIAVDKNNRIWVNSYTEGLRVWDGDDWDQILPSENYPHISIPKVIALDENDQLWCVTYEGRVYLHDVTGIWHDYTPLGNEFSVASPNDLEISPKGEIWIATSYGVGVFNPPEK